MLLSNTDFLELHEVLKLAMANLASIQIYQICFWWTILFQKVGSTAAITFEKSAKVIFASLKSLLQIPKLFALIG